MSLIFMWHIGRRLGQKELAARAFMYASPNGYDTDGVAGRFIGGQKKKSGPRTVTGHGRECGGWPGFELLSRDWGFRHV